MNQLSLSLVLFTVAVVGSWARRPADFRIPINGTRGARYFATRPSSEVGRRHRSYDSVMKRCHPFELGIGVYYQMDVMLKPDVTETVETLEPIVYAKYRWPGGKVPYVIKGNFSAAHKTIISQAMAQYTANTCVRFIPQTTETTFVTINNEPTGCWAYVGRSLNNSYNHVNLQIPGCLTTGTVAHELMHTLGFYHEFTRTDRDSYVTIDVEALDPMYRTDSFFNANYGKLTANLTPLYGIPYNYGSVMHYSKWAGAFNVSKPVMNNTKPWTGDFGNKVGLAATDIQAINAMYACPLT